MDFSSPQVRDEDNCNLQFRFRPAGYDYSDGYAMVIVQKSPIGELYISNKLILSPLGKTGCISHDLVQLSKREMQQLFDKLWELGFRPIDGTGNSGHILAINNHLQDMRELVFKKKY